MLPRTHSNSQKHMQNQLCFDSFVSSLTCNIVTFGTVSKAISFLVSIEPFLHKGINIRSEEISNDERLDKKSG